jgi:hypothetical protein
MQSREGQTGLHALVTSVCAHRGAMRVCNGDAKAIAAAARNLPPPPCRAHDPLAASTAARIRPGSGVAQPLRAPGGAAR